MTARRRARARQLLLAARGVALVVAFLLALHGFSRAYRDLRGHPGTLANNLFHALHLVTGEFPDELDDRRLPWTLSLARWAVPLLTVWTAAGVLWLKLRNPLRLRWVRRRGEHLVLAGGPPLAPALVESEARARRPTLLWVDDPAAGWIGEAGNAGAPHVPATGTHGGVDTLGLARARAALLIHDDDGRNIGLAAAVLEQAAKERPPGDPLAVLARVDDLDLRASIADRFRAGADHAIARLRLLSLPDLIARRLFVDAPLDAFVRVEEGARLVLALGFSPLVESYALRLLAGGHHRDGTRPRLVALTPDAEACERVFRARRPGADTLSPVLFEQAAIDRPALLRGVLDTAIERYGAPVAILIDPGDEARALALAFAAESWFRDRGMIAPPIHARIGPCPDARLGGMIRRLGGADWLADPEALLQEEHDALARSIHDVYYEGRLAAGHDDGSHASIAEWEALPEGMRDDNRLVADCYRLKLRDIGARLTHGTAATFHLEPEELEELARAEHDRWMAAKLVGGWKHGDTRDDARKLHPDMVGYDALSEAVKDLDREQIRLMTRLLPRAGLVPRRVLTVLVEADPDAAPVAAALEDLRARFPDRVIALAGRIDAPAVRQALADHGDVPTQIALVENVDLLLDRLPAAERARVSALVRRADTIWAFPAGTTPERIDAWLHARAEARIGVRSGG